MTYRRSSSARSTTYNYDCYRTYREDEDDDDDEGGKKLL